MQNKSEAILISLHAQSSETVQGSRAQHRKGEESFYLPVDGNYEHETCCSPDHHCSQLNGVWDVH